MHFSTHEAGIVCTLSKVQVIGYCILLMSSFFLKEYGQAEDPPPSP